MKYNIRDRSGFDQKLYHTWISREPIAVADDDTTKPFPTPTILGIYHRFLLLFFANLII